MTSLAEIRGLPAEGGVNGERPRWHWSPQYSTIDGRQYPSKMTAMIAKQCDIQEQSFTQLSKQMGVDNLTQNLFIFKYSTSARI